MSPKFMRFIVDILIVICLIGAGFYFRADLTRFIRETRQRLAPCSVPIMYSLGEFNSKAGVTKVQFLAAAKEAIGLWETSKGRKLFEYSSSTSPDLTLNLIYDYRQKATQGQQRLSGVIQEDRSQLDQAMTDKYNALVSSYNTEKIKLNAMISAYDSLKASYEQQVDYWNNKGGAPRDEYNKLQQQKAELAAKYEQINQLQVALNAKGSEINSLAANLNAKIKELNLHIGAYNTIGASTGGEFNAGEYISDASGSRINIYQFDNQTKLVRVLAHEFGHALGLNHVEDPKAIMYKYNEGANDSLTISDVEALDAVCRN